MSDRTSKELVANLWPPDGYPDTFTDLLMIVNNSRVLNLSLENATTALAVHSITEPIDNTTKEWFVSYVKRRPQLNKIVSKGINAEKLEERGNF